MLYQSTELHLIHLIFFNLLNQVCQGISWNSNENATMIAKVVPPEGALHDLKNKLLKKKATVIGS